VDQDRPEGRLTFGRSLAVVPYLGHVGWLLGYKPPLDAKLLDAAMLALGRALYLCSTFEDKCRFILQVMQAEELIQERTTSDDPVGSLEELFSHLPRLKMLGGTIADIIARAELLRMSEEEQVALTRAKNARNFIAHDAKDIGALDSVRREHVAEFISKLRAAVADVAAGDNFVSKIVFRIEERWEPIPHVAVNYVDLIDLWVFGHLIHSGEPALWSLIFHQGLPGVPPAARRSIRLPPAAPRPPSPFRGLNRKLRVEEIPLGSPSRDADVD
jgi:hypothetical protein